MPNLLTWVRECDEPLFAPIFAEHPEVRAFNARVTQADLGKMDALLLSGGPDISAEFLRQEISDASLIKEPDPARDAWEFAALRHALEAGRPVLAICKGMQVFNVALGGTLRLDIPGHYLPEQRSANVQPLRFAARTSFRLEKVNSSHHQAVDKLGDGFEIEAWSASDDIIEQMRLRDYPFGFAVQYHPERDKIYRGLFNDFFAQIA
jgi:putative glutamine amidotransferase